MPCKDITDRLILHFDFDNNLRNYSLRKLTCGGEVGDNTLILDWVKNKNAEHIIAVAADVFQGEVSWSDEVEEYLQLKHFFAIQSGIQVYLGNTTGGAEDECTLVKLEYGEDGIEVILQIKVDVIVEKIESCGNCSSCGKFS